MPINFDQVFSNDFKSITLINHLEIILSFSQHKRTFRNHGRNLEKVRNFNSTMNWSSCLFEGYE